MAVEGVQGVLGPCVSALATATNIHASGILRSEHTYRAVFLGMQPRVKSLRSSYTGLSLELFSTFEFPTELPTHGGCNQPCRPASERRGNTLKHSKGFYLKVRARIWP